MVARHNTIFNFLGATTLFGVCQLFLQFLYFLIIRFFAFLSRYIYNIFFSWFHLAMVIRNIEH